MLEEHVLSPIIYRICYIPQ